MSLVVAGEEGQQINFALSTPDGTYGLGVKFGVARHAISTRQEVSAMMALNVLRRWLNGQPLESEHGWIEVVESASL
ncbi:CinA-like protein [Cedecea lapagei]|uniref:CinA-like protein n=1 Tax=Cedecea lapagei TaxID=158823 RepID=A0A3S4JAB6_9ENTR|nr:CinA-like protein [Cedecea lapagei]